MNTPTDKPTFYAAMVVTLIGLMVNLGIKHSHEHDDWQYLFSAIIIETLLASIASVTFATNKELRPLSKGIAIGMGLNLLIGFSVCTS